MRIAWNKGLKLPPHSIETIEKIRLKAIGRKHTLESRKKMSLSHTGKPFSKLQHEGILRTRHRGSESHLWKGGITPLRQQISQLLEYFDWRKSVFERDNWTCRECNIRGGELHSHHNIKPFFVILQEFLKEYHQFSPIEDKETLVRLAITYKPFWEVSNGKTLCEDCHNQFHSDHDVRLLRNLA